MFYEIFLKEKKASPEDWKKVIDKIGAMAGYLSSLEIYIFFDSFLVSYYIEVKKALPSTIDGISSFFFKRCDKPLFSKRKKRFFLLPILMNYMSLRDYIKSKYQENVCYYKLHIRKITEERYIARGTCVTEEYEYQMPLTFPFFYLAVDYNQNTHIKTKSIPAYFDLTKHKSELKAKGDKNILSISGFPFSDKEYYYNIDSFSFWKHSIIFGSSGCGKSKFISSFIYNLYLHYKDDYKVILIDPHASLEHEIGDLGQVIRFINNNRINLFSANKGEIITNVEILISLFKNVIANYNAKLERVLRYSIFLLLKDKSFCFTNLRKLILELEYRNKIIAKYKEELPDSVVSFFLVEFASIKTQYYGDAISPIIGFIDEMELNPVFNKEQGSKSLLDELNNNFLTLFSLNRTILGDNAVKMTSGLLMQQLMDIITNRELSEHIIFIIDEVAVVENPILIRFLSEARKYNLSLIMCGQYFNQLSSSLKDSIFANVVNYFLFRLSYFDAENLSQMTGLKLGIEDSKEKRYETLNRLKARECIFRVEKEGTLLPPIKGRTLDFARECTIAFSKEEIKIENTLPKKEFSFSVDGGDIRKMMEESSSSRMV